jgi:hypothetical protein
MLTTLSGCRDITIRTIINNDGTITRTYAVMQDIQLKKNSYTEITEDKITSEINRQIADSYFPIDTAWETQFHADTINQTTTIKFSKTYKNVKKLQEDFDSKNYKLKPLSPKVEVKRNFKWFSTVNIYKESYQRIFKGKPYKEYFTEDEILQIRKGKNSENDSIQRKYYAWVAYAIVDEIITIINSESDSAHNLNAWKKFMYDKISENTFSTPSEDQNPFIIPEISGSRNDFDFSDAETLISSLKRYSDIQLPKEKLASIQRTLEAKMELYMSLFTDNLLFNVKMPGKILETNADSLKGKSIYWKMDPFIAGANVEMIVKTRQSNAGIPITLAVVVIAILSYWMLRKKRR